MTWFFFALATAVFWGAGYAISEKILQSGISPAFFMFFLCVISAPLYLAYGLWHQSMGSSWAVFSSDNYKIGLTLVGVCFVFIFGNLFIYQAISMKNATHANLIEISYPIFTILFTWLFYRNYHLDWTTAIGGLLILSGTLLILYKGHA